MNWTRNLFPVYIWLVLWSSIACKKESVSNKNTLPPTDQNTFTNPVLSSGPDPWVTQKDGFYYYTHTLGNRIGLAKTNAITQLKNQSLTTVWSPPPGQAYSENIWAPELHFLDGKWYIYFAADNGNDVNHRMYVLENSANDPTTGQWVFKGKITDVTDKWAIDGSILEYNGQRYFMWSGWRGDNDPGIQQIYIARMLNPWTLEGTRVMISEPTHGWERNGLVNEGPQALKNSSGRVFIIYSGSGCWTDDYALGMLTLREGGNPLNPADWTKRSTPVFSKDPGNGVYGPGHNSFFKSPDGTEDWIIYHANSSPGRGCGDARSPRIQKFTWNADGTPKFESPVATGARIARPSGEVK